MAALSGLDIVIPSWISWGGVQLIMHKTALHLAESGNRVLFCDAPYAFTTMWLHPEFKQRIKNDFRNWRGGVRRIAPNLHVWTPPPLFFQMGILGVIDGCNHQLMRRSMAGVVRSLGFRRPLVWSYHPFYLADEAFLDPCAVIFDCNDRIAAYHSNQKKRRLLDPMEARLLRRADRVMVTASTLREDLGTIREDLLYLPSGVDEQVVERAADPNVEIAPDVAAIPHPRVGYLGAIDPRLDYDLLVALAMADPQWQLVMVGPELSPAPAALKALPNVHFLGGREPHELAGYLAAFDVGLIPFRKAKYVRYMFPTKSYEYLAAGIPTVSVEIPALRDLEPLVRVAAEPGEFVAAVAAALEESGEEATELRRKRIAEARANTWPQRFAKADAVVAEVLRSKGLTLPA